MLSDDQFIFAKNIAEFINFAAEKGFKLTFGEAFRTESQQWMYLNGYEIKNAQLVKAPKKSTTANSNHLRRLAVDFNFFYDGKLTTDFDTLKPLFDYWESLHVNNRCGGDFNRNNLHDDRFYDAPHFEMNV